MKTILHKQIKYFKYTTGKLVNSHYIVIVVKIAHQYILWLNMFWF